MRSDVVAHKPFVVPATPCRPTVVERRFLVLAVSCAFSVFLFCCLRAPLGAALNRLEVLGAGIFFVLLWAGTFNLILYVIGYVQESSLKGGTTGLMAADAPPSAACHTAAILTRTAIVMPIYHEDTIRVAAGIRQAWRSCKTCGLDEHCDWYLLCDSTDPEICRQEEQIVERLLPEFGFNRGPLGRLFLVRRADRTNFKAGNIMNFLDQHGDGYDFMVVLDADSVMLGKSIERLILTLQEHPRMGILQTLMIPIRSATPFARAMQYSTARCLPLYAKGMLWFYDRDSVYWGHNALIRVAPFREHCRLPTLPGKPPLGGTIMSQDIVEAAFLGRAGWEVGWLMDGGGSFDELPANILTYGQRDRRWCQGNFQHYRFILAPGIRFGHRLYFANGIFSYLASPLLLLLILLGTTQAWLAATPTPDPWLLWASMGLFWFQMLTPRALGLIHFARQRSENVQRPHSVNPGHPLTPSLSPSEGERVPGWRSRDTPRASWRWLWREAASTLAELVLNLLMGPLLFYLHTRFVAEILSGGHVVWRNQSRNPGERVSWASAGRVFWLPSLLGLLGLVAANHVGFPLALFILPVAVSWLLSIPLAVLTSDAALGSRLLKAGFFPDALTAEELEHLGPLANDPPAEVGSPCPRLLFP
jgi:membrane glycosyltransferase